MKRKLDFITNSSSCSFVVWGITTDVDVLKKKCGKQLFKLFKEKEAKKEAEKAIRVKKSGALFSAPNKPSKEELTKEYEEFINDDDFAWTVESHLDGLEVQHMPYEDDLMIGKSPFSIKEDQTMKEFKQEICDKFKSMGMDLEPNELHQIEECWMDC